MNELTQVYGSNEIPIIATSFHHLMVAPTATPKAGSTQNQIFNSASCDTSVSF